MARSFNWSSIKASGGGGFEPLPAGPYVVKITDAIDNEAKEYVEVVFDIAEGDKAGYYSDEFGKRHPYAHHFFMSYKETALGMLKGRLECIQRSNPGFDPFAAWDAGRFDMFANRLVGVNLQEEEYLNPSDELRTRLSVCQVVDAQAVRDGKVRARPKKPLKGRPGGAAPIAASAPAAFDGEIPFN